MISTFRWNRRFRKVSVNKTLCMYKSKQSNVSATIHLHYVKCKISFIQTKYYFLSQILTSP